MGFEHTPSGRLAVTLVAALAVVHGSLVVALWAPHWLVTVAAVLLAVVGGLTVGTLGHTASHGSLFASDRANRLALWLTYPFMLGLSGRYWLHSHVAVHHPSPNVVDVDDDANLRPLFRLNDADLARDPVWLRRLFRFQLVWLLALLPLNGASMQLQGLAYWQRELRQGRRHRAACVRDLLGIALHFGTRVGAPLLFFPASRVLVVYAAWLALMGFGLFAVLAPGHFPHAARVLATNQQRAASFWLRQTAATVNFRTGWLGKIVCSGLQYQIEHHLFPRYSHVHYEKMAPLVQALCARHRLPYTRLGWGEAIYESLRTFVVPKPVVSNVEELLVDRASIRPAASLVSEHGRTPERVSETNVAVS